jgi:hypothetical protein
MAIVKLSSLAASVAVLALSLITLTSTPVVLEAIDCGEPEGATRGAECLDNYPNGGYLCWQCVWQECAYAAQGDQECYETCSSVGVQMCGGA